MKLKTVQATAIKSVFEVLKDIISDVNIVFDKHGVELKTLDTAKVTFIYMFLDAKNFEVYECPTRVVAGLNISNTFKLLKTISTNDTLEICVTDYMEIKIENTQKKSNTVFRMKLLDINEDEYDVENLVFDVITIIPSIGFQKIVREMSTFSSSVCIRRYDNKLELKCNGDFVDQMTEIECTDSTEKEYANEYSLKYINMFAKSTNISSNLSIQQRDDGPISFKYYIGNLGEIEFYLAPKTDS